jgi:hypothetical protein
MTFTSRRVRARSVASCVCLAVTAIIAAAAPIGSAAAAFKFKRIVDTDTPVPGGGGATFTFNNSDIPAVSGDRVVFGTADGFVWTAKPNGKGLTKVITPDTKVPGQASKFRQIFGDWVQIVGDTVVLVGDNCGGCGSGIGMYTVPAGGGRVKRLVDTDTKEPGGGGATLQNFSNDFDVSDSHVVFTNGQHVWNVALDGGRLHLVAGDVDSGATPPGRFCCLFDHPTLRDDRVLLRASNGIGEASVQSVDVNGHPTTFRVTADDTTHAPGTSRNYLFNTFKFATPASGDRNVFYGQSIAPSKPNVDGIYSRGDGSGAIAKLVDSKTPVPGGSGNFSFAWFGSLSPFAAKNGIVVFGAVDGAGVPGLYAVSENGGPITKIIRQGDAVGGATVDLPNMRRSGFDGTTLVFRVVYVGGSSGLYSTEVTLP